MSKSLKMQSLVAAYNWAQTPLGSRQAWPKSLIAVVEVVLRQPLAMIVLWGPELIQIYNDGYAEISGDKHPAGLGRPTYQVWPEVVWFTQPLYTRVLRGESIALKDQLLLLKRRGDTEEEAYISISYSPLIGDGGEIGGILAVLNETTQQVMAERERVRAQTERDRLAEQRRLALDAAQMGWWHLNPLTGDASWDERVTQIYGVSPGRSGHTQVLAQMHRSDRVVVEREMAAALDPSRAKPYYVEYRLFRSDGSVRWVESLGQANFEGEGAHRRAVAFYGTAVDVTQRKLAEQQAQLLGELGPLLLPLSDPAEIMERTAEAVGRHMGTHRCYFAEWDEDRGRVTVPGEWRSDDAAPLSGVYQLREFGSDEMRHQLSSSLFSTADVDVPAELTPYRPSYRALRIRAFATAPFKRDRDRVVTLVVTSQRPRNWRADEVALLENVLARSWPLVERARTEVHSRLLVRLTEMLAEVNDPDAIVAESNRLVGEHLAVDRCYFFEDLGRDNRVRVGADWRPAGAPSVAGEYALEEFGTKEWWAAVKQRPMMVDDTANEAEVDADKYRALGIAAYATVPFVREGHWMAGLAVASSRSRRWSEDELKLLENVIARVWPVVERARVGAVLLLTNERLTLALDAGRLGDFSWEVDGDHILASPRTLEMFEYENSPSLTRSDLRDLLHPHDRERARSANLLALATHTDYDIEYRVRRRAGGWRWIATKGRGIYDEQGRPKGMRGVIQDITAQKESEEKLRQQEAQLRAHASELEQRVEERTTSLREAIAQMEEFSYSVSHDLRGPLRAMHAYAEALLEDCGPQLDAAGRMYAERIALSCRRMEDLTQDILTYSRIARADVALAAVDLDGLVNDVISQYVQLQPPNADVLVDTPLHRVMGHEASLGQIISNLLTNAQKFVAPGVKPVIRVRTVVSDGRVRVSVEDNGIGIDQPHQARLFRVFERLPTDVKYEGTGIGLAIVRKAAEKMGGQCGVESDGRNGSRFWIELKAAP